MPLPNYITVGEVVSAGWASPHPQDSVIALVQHMEGVLIITFSRIWRAVRSEHDDSFVVNLIGHI